jgi:hypothetical protein
MPIGSFVSGVLGGMDWREARDYRGVQRKRDDSRWDWEQKDRDWTGQQREWTREDREYMMSNRARAGAERAGAAARAAEDKEWFRSNWNPNPRSVMPAVTGFSMGVPDAPAGPRASRPQLGFGSRQMSVVGAAGAGQSGGIGTQLAKFLASQTRAA